MHLTSLVRVIAFATAWTTALCAQKGGGTTAPPADAAVAFRGDLRLTLARADGTGQTAIGTQYLAYAPMAWTQAGGPLVFEDRASSAIYRIQPNGTGQTLLARLAATDSTAHGVAVTRRAPCPDGTHRVFYIDGVQKDTLWTVRLDGSDPRPLGGGVDNLTLWGPMVSSSGDKVVVIEELGDLVVLTLGLVGGQLGVVQRESLVWYDPGHPLHGFILWSAWLEDTSPHNPGGTQLVLVANPDPFVVPDQIYRLDLAAPTVVQQLPAPASSIHGVSVSADGNWLFYGATNSSGGTSIFRANRDGTGAIDWSLAGRRKSHVFPCTRP